MTEQQDEGNRPSEGDSNGEPDLRSVLGGGARRPVVRRTPQETGHEAEATPYEPPVRPGAEPQERDLQRDEPRSEPGRGEAQKLPPVWPGDENQPWFRRERGLSPLPESEDDRPAQDLEELPTPLAELPARGRAFGITTVMPTALLFVIPLIGNLLLILIFVANLFLYRQGQDVGAVIFRLRVVRENGDVAGFFHMWVRSAAATISLLALGAGFWTAFSDPYRRTWHDRLLKTYVVKDSAEYNTRKRSSSEAAFQWFWITLLLFIALSIVFAITSAPVTETTAATPTAG